MFRMRSSRRGSVRGLMLLAICLFACHELFVASTSPTAYVDAPGVDEGSSCADHGVKIACLVVVMSFFLSSTEPQPASPPPAEAVLEKRADYNKVLIFSAYLCLLSGFLNAVCILQMGMTVAHHTGNASHTGRLWGIDAQRFAMSIIGFWVGAAVAGYHKCSGETLYCGRWSPALLSSGIAVAVAVILQHDGAGPLVSVPLFAFSQGLQNAVTRKHSAVPICTTHVTGYLTDFGSGIGAWARGMVDGSGPGLRRPMFFALSFFTFALGGYVAKKSTDKYGVQAAYIPAVLMMITALGLVPMSPPKQAKA
eukprot:TRINITY_DN4662_c0_g1_i3.p1 TRINITY_DN4662_c0_g1~~TRINITY_DN4662_c0_g1_i3.p1  ORF type:complete len:309 (-),score=54.16 TRINITY_DN4662_c0_g1_i3:122-1048(-)